MESVNELTSLDVQALANFFNTKHDKLLCSANRKGEPSIAIMGTPRVVENGTVDFEISDLISQTLQNIQENKAVVFMAFVPGVRARDYSGARIYADVVEILTSGEKIEQIRTRIRERHGEDKANELQATVTCRIRTVRPLVDRGQRWDEAPFGNI